MQNQSEVELYKEIDACSLNNFGRENFDENRFGEYAEREYSFQWLRTLLNRRKIKQEYYDKANALLSVYGDRIQSVYNLLPDTDKKLLIQLLAYRLMGFGKVKLPLNTPQYKQYFEQAEGLVCSKETLDPHFLGFILRDFDLKAIGYNVRFFFTNKGVVTDFMIEQYAYRKNQVKVEVVPGDVVLDLGACWGDTALYFANKAGAIGKVYSFEFIPGNISIFEKNLSLNPSFHSTIEIVQNPVSDKSGKQLFYFDNGPGSKVEDQPFSGQTGTAITESIDEFVAKRGIEKVDFIKMDIEGSEPYALLGAIETLRKFKPKLAIAIYHSMDDFTNIPLWINNLGLGYKLYLDHFTIHSEETILFAQAD